jgi:amidohydrolase
MERACGVVRALGGGFALSIYPGYQPVVNDPGLTNLVRKTATDLIGAENVCESPLEMGGEDFCYFAEEAPGCFVFLGGAFPGEEPRRHHHPQFDVDERCLPIGTALLAEAAIRFLKGASRQ